LPFTCCGIIFIYLKWPAYTWKTPCQPQSVHSLGMLVAENVTLPQLHDFGLQTRCKWDMRSWDFTQHRLVVCCRRFTTKFGGCEILIAVLVKIQVIWDVSPFWLVRLPSSSGPTVQDEGTTFHRNSITLHQSTGRNLQHLCKNVMSHRTEGCARPSYCVWRVFYGSVKIIAAFTKAPYWTYFSFRAVWYIKTQGNTNKCTILQSVLFLLHVGANWNNM